MREWIRTALVGLVIAGAALAASDAGGTLQRSDLFRRFFTWSGADITTVNGGGITSSAASGSNGFALSTTGARVDFSSAGSLDYCDSSGTGIQCRSVSALDTDTLGLVVTSKVANNQGSPAVTFTAASPRIATGAQYIWYNGAQELMELDPVPGFPTAPILTVEGAVAANGNTSAAAYTVEQAGGSGTVAMDCHDVGNGCYLPFFCTETPNYNTHGCAAFSNRTHLDGGFIIQAENPGGIGYSPSATTDNLFSVDVFGGFGQPMRAATFGAGAHTFPLCPDPNAAVNTFGQGTSGSMLHWGADTSHYYVCKTGNLPDAGNSGYVQVGENNPVFLPAVAVAAPITAVILDGFIEPSGAGGGGLSYAAIHFNVSVAGSGGSTNVNIRAQSSGGLQCDFAFACNTGTGPKRIVGSGSGCTTIPAGDTVTWSITTLGNCGGGAASFSGNQFTPEGLWQ